jgi:predicted negative regulator of RcsB-dependent stress response
VVGESNALTRLNGWIGRHKRGAAYLAVLLVVAVALFAWNFLSAKTAERSAGRQIAQGRLALDSKNYPLAASVLSQVVENFSGTHAAQEASILLAQTRLAQGQTQQAIDVLQRSAPKADRYFRAQTYGLLGAAYENVLRP